VLLQVPCVHESFVHFTPSSQSAAEQQVVPQVADKPAARGQHFWPSAQNGACWHWLPEQESFVHGSLSLHCESSQHSAQPTPAQHRAFLGSAQAEAVWSQSEVSARHVSSVHESPSSQSAAAAQFSLRRQSALAEQYSSALQLALFGACVQPPAKHSSSVHFTPSSQSAPSQHWPHDPSQHFSVAPHLGARAHAPSAPHSSTVHGSESSQSSGPSHATLGPSPPEAALPGCPPAPAPPLPPTDVNLAPPQAYAVKEHSASITATRNQ